MASMPMSSTSRNPRPKGQALTDLMKDTNFSVDRGFYTETQTLIISSETEDAAIYYTLDVSDPAPSAVILYQDPITIDKTTLVRAIATKEGMISTLMFHKYC
ncbi:MAG: hypothetical protein ACI8T1_005083 [Verrucomicrobiales bacterium]|jgi:hypothetical protein